MRGQFVRMLISIVFIMIIVLAVQCVVLAAMNIYVAHSWKETVFDEFALAIKQSVTDNSVDNSDGIVNIMVNNTSERISGLIIRDEEGEFSFSLGASPKGVPVPQLDGYNSAAYAYINTTKLRFVSDNDTSEGEAYSINKPKYEIAITAPRQKSIASGLISPPVVSKIEFIKKSVDGKTDVVYPVELDAKDIAGTIVITVNGEPAAYIDVLVYNLDYYNPTKFIMMEFVKSFIATLPVAILITIVAAYVVSKKNERVVKSMQDALAQLSNGEHDVRMIDSSISEYQSIKRSIEKLDADLLRHSKSRKEWIKNISHDLNTPVTSMNLLLDGAQDGFFPINMDLIKSLKKENDTLTARIASVSYYSYLLTPNVKFEPRVLTVMELADPALQSINAKFIVEFSLETYLYGDTELVQRALIEVLKNANTYKIGDEEPTINAYERDDRTIITVTNKGKLPEPRPQFFEPWARGDESRTAGGSGLGLPIVYQIMELHSGSVSIAESEGYVAVTLTFPKKP